MGRGKLCPCKALRLDVHELSHNLSTTCWAKIEQGAFKP